MKRLKVVDSSSDGPLSARRARNLPPIMPKGLVVSFKAEGKRMSMTLSSDRSSLVPYIREVSETDRSASALQWDRSDSDMDSLSVLSSLTGSPAQHFSNIAEQQESMRAHSQEAVRARVQELQQGHKQSTVPVTKQEYVASHFAGKQHATAQVDSQQISRTASQESNASSINEFFLTGVEDADEFASKFSSVRKRTSIVLSDIEKSLEQKNLFDATSEVEGKPFKANSQSVTTDNIRFVSSSQTEKQDVNDEKIVISVSIESTVQDKDSNGEGRSEENQSHVVLQEEPASVAEDKPPQQDEVAQALPEQISEASVEDQLVVEHASAPVGGETPGVLEEIASFAGQSGSKALTVESALTELYQLHDLKAQISKSNLAEIYNSAQQERMGWKKKIKNLSVKMSQISFPYALLVYQPMTDKVTLLSVWGESISEVSACAFSDVVVKKNGDRTDGSSNIPAGTVLIRIPSTSALPPTILFPAEVWTKIVEARSKKNVYRAPLPRAGSRSSDFARSASRSSSSLEGVRSRSLREKTAFPSSPKLAEKDLPKTVEELRRLNNYVGFVIPGMHDDVNVEIVPLHLSGSISSWPRADGHQEDDVLGGMGNLNLSSAIKTYGEKKRESLTAEKAQGDNKIDSLEDKDKDRTFMIKESNELSPTNKLRFAEVVALCEDLFLDELAPASLASSHGFYEHLRESRLYTQQSTSSSSFSSESSMYNLTWKETGTCLRPSTMDSCPELKAQLKKIHPSNLPSSAFLWKRGISFSGRAGAKQRHYEKMQVVRKLQGESPARLQQTWGSGSLGVPRLRTTSSLIPAGKNSRVLEFEGLRGEPPPVRQEYEFEELE
uniref:Uncharacterized protein n=1 Tax=Hanusia phi TaxID=3032 RepID=A0A7S0ETZ6_9CRYP|mmetsp:Transcript_30787/g.69411  ORF Transcript_30787/g.69411 Transcript_30787/m.69411 type:complete len:839 (+) Transcript_30787:127-2643(+)